MAINFRSNTIISNLRIGPLSGGGNGGGGGGSSEPSFLAVGAYTYDGSAANSGGVLVYDLSNLSATPTIISPSGLSAGDQFGYTMFAGNGSLVIQARSDDDIANSSGAVYVYDTSNLSASPTKLAPSQLGVDSRFGDGAIAVNSNQIIIGASNYNSRNGGVWVYDKSNLSSTPTLLEAGSADRYGYSVAANDTYIAVGEIDDAGNAGALHVYDATNLSTAPTVLNATSTGTKFGARVTFNNDYLIVSAQTDSTVYTSSGAVYAFSLNNLSATPTKLTLPSSFGNTTNAQIGRYGLSASDDYIVAGSDNFDRVYVYDVSNFSAAPTSVQPSDIVSGDQFGLSVSVLGSTLAVGAPNVDGSTNNNGAVYVYDITNLSASPTKIDEGETGNYNGQSVALF